MREEGCLLFILRNALDLQNQWNSLPLDPRKIRWKVLPIRWIVTPIQWIVISSGLFFFAERTLSITQQVFPYN